MKFLRWNRSRRNPTATTPDPKIQPQNSASATLVDAMPLQNPNQTRSTPDSIRSRDLHLQQIYLDRGTAIPITRSAVNGDPLNSRKTSSQPQWIACETLDLVPPPSSRKHRSSGPTNHQGRETLEKVHRTRDIPDLGEGREKPYQKPPYVTEPSLSSSRLPLTPPHQKLAVTPAESKI